jgi:U3 small nucleolar RNA-associated protein 24
VSRLFSASTLSVGLKACLRSKSVREDNEKRMAPPPIRNAPAASAALWFRHNEHLGPPYHVILDTNTINFA